MSTEQSEATKKSPPVWFRRVIVKGGAVEIAVFEKLLNEGTEKERQTYQISAKRSYKEGNEFKPAPFWPEDVPHAIQLLSQAHAWITDQLHQ